MLRGRFVRTGLLALPSAKYQAAIINWYDRDNDGDLDVVIALQENASLWRWWEKLHKSGDVKGKDDRFDWKILAYRNLTQNATWLQLQAGRPCGQSRGHRGACHLDDEVRAAGPPGRQP